MLFKPSVTARATRWLAIAIALAVVLAWFALAPRALSATAATSPSSSTSVKSSASASLEQCVTAAEPAERSATFSGEMTALAGTSKMEMRIDVLERQPGETAFRTLAAPGLGVWRTAAPGVKTYKYLKQVTNLSAPAYYRAAVRFRWLNAKGKLIKASELRTPRCLQTAQSSEEPAAGEPPAKNA
jgi:hypothetical protein